MVGAGEQANASRAGGILSTSAWREGNASPGFF
jgi:hypothetical protein